MAALKAARKPGPVATNGARRYNAAMCATAADSLACRPLYEAELVDLAATAGLSGALARAARVGDVLGLRGELGAGKTTFARFFVNALMAADVEVPSPTFNLVQHYETPAGTVWHFDLYRLEDAAEAYELGIEEAFLDGISLIEWPERLGALLPADCLDVHFEHGRDPSRRHVRLAGGGDWPRRLRRLAAELGHGA